MRHNDEEVVLFMIKILAGCMTVIMLLGTAIALRYGIELLFN